MSLFVMKEASRRNLGEINAGMTKNYQDIDDVLYVLKNHY